MHPVTVYDAAMSVHRHATAARAREHQVALRLQERAVRAAAKARTLPRPARRSTGSDIATTPQRATADVPSPAEGCLVPA